MADGISIDVQGLSAIKTQLDGLTKEAGDRAIRKALRAGAEIVRAEVVARAPIKTSDGGYLAKGALKSDIIVRIKRDEQGQLQAIVKPGRISAFAALLTEYGHRMVRGGRSRLLANGKTRGPGKVLDKPVPPHPFIRTSYEATQRTAADAICTTLAAEVSKEAAKK